MALTPEECMDEVRARMLAGETRVSKICTMINTKHRANIKRQAVEQDMQKVRDLNSNWLTSMAEGDQALRIQHYDGILAENIDILQDMIRRCAEDDSKGAFKIGQFYSQLLATMQFQIALARDHSLYLELKKRHAMVREREADIERIIKEARKRGIKLDAPAEVEAAEG